MRPAPPLDVPVAERVGFEPTVRLRAHTISNRARSATPAPLRGAFGQDKSYRSPAVAIRLDAYAMRSGIARTTSHLRRRSMRRAGAEARGAPLSARNNPSGGEGGIRTREAHHLPFFENGTINRSDTSPPRVYRQRTHPITSCATLLPPTSVDRAVAPGMRAVSGQDASLALCMTRLAALHDRLRSP